MIKYFGLLILLLCGSCGPIATFEEPQPEKVKSLEQIPKKLRGKYLSVDLKRTLLVSKYSMIINAEYYEKHIIDSLPSYLVLREDSLFRDSVFYQLVNIKKDTVYERVMYSDTLISFQKNGQIKKYKGYYFINRFLSENNWEVKKLKLSKGVLTISEINTIEEINLLKEITETPQDSVDNNFKLSKKQFKEFINANGFQGEEIYLKVNKTK